MSTVITNLVMKQYERNTKTDTKPSTDLGEAIKAYADEQLTGLTDEEKAEIDKQIKAYLESNKVETKDEIDGFNAFVKSLMKKYGFKGEPEEFLGAVSGVPGEKAAPNSTIQKAEEARTHFNMNQVYAFGSRNKITNEV